jgi:hypothetical protein
MSLPLPRTRHARQAACVSAVRPRPKALGINKHLRGLHFVVGSVKAVRDTDF